MRTTRAMLIALLVTCSVVGAGLGPATATASVQEQTPCNFPFTATDATGTEITVDERPERVTTLNPSAAQTMWEIGGREQVVGLSQFALYLDGAESRQNVSAAGFGVNNEKVVGTDPDLVLAPNSISNETVLALRDAGLTVFRFEGATSIADIEAKTTLTGRLTGNCQGATEANAWMTQNVDAAQSAVEGAERPRVIYPLGGGFVAGDGTFIDAMITASGGSNVVADFGLAGYPELSDEEVIESGPEIVLITTPGGAAILDSEPYASTPAAENNRTVYVERNYLNQPAPRSVVYAVGNMTAGFHPDAYGEAEFVTRAEVAASMETDESTASDSATTATGEPSATQADDGTSTAEQTDATSPGFGVAAAVLALVATTLLATRRR